MPMHVATPLGYYLIVDQVLRSCVMIVEDFDTCTDLIMLDMVDFYAIPGMYLLSPYHTILE